MMLTLKSSPKSCFCFIFWCINEKTWSVIISGWPWKQIKMCMLKKIIIYLCLYMKRTNQKLKQNFWSNITVREHAASIFQMSGLQASCSDTLIPLRSWQKQLHCTYCNRPSLLSLFITSVQHTHIHIDTHVNTITLLACNNGQLNDSHLWVISWAELLASTGIQDTNTLTMAREKIVI